MSGMKKTITNKKYQ